MSENPFNDFIAATTLLVETAIAVIVLLTGCSTPYSSTAAPPPTKGKPLEYYNMGQSDAVKRQYWITRALQKEKQRSEPVAYRTRYYTFNIAPDPQANINKVPYNITLPILE